MVVVVVVARRKSRRRKRRGIIDILTNSHVVSTQPWHRHISMSLSLWWIITTALAQTHLYVPVTLVDNHHSPGTDTSLYVPVTVVVITTALAQTHLFMSQSLWWIITTALAQTHLFMSQSLWWIITTALAQTHLYVPVTLTITVAPTMGKIVLDRTLPTLHPHSLPLCSNYPVYKYPRAMGGIYTYVGRFAAGSFVTHA